VDPPMKKVYIIHQWEAGADADWRPWLKGKLEKLGYHVFVPEMPDIETPIIEEWVSELSRIVGKPDKNTYFIGHSIGCQAILRFLEKIDSPVCGAVFVAGWFDLENLEDEETVAIARPWVETPIDLDKIKTILPKSTLIISDNDPFGAFETNKNKFRELGSKIVVLHDAGHMTKDDGYVEFPELLSEFKKISA